MGCSAICRALLKLDRPSEFSGTRESKTQRGTFFSERNSTKLRVIRSTGDGHTGMVLSIHAALRVTPITKHAAQHDQDGLTR